MLSGAAEGLRNFSFNMLPGTVPTINKKEQSSFELLIAMAFNLLAMASNLIAMAFNLEGMASNLLAQPTSDGLQPNSSKQRHSSNLGKLWICLQSSGGATCAYLF